MFSGNFLAGRMMEHSATLAFGVGAGAAVLAAITAAALYACLSRTRSPVIAAGAAS